MGDNPKHSAIVDNTGEARGTSSAIESNDDVLNPSLCTVL